MQCYYCKSKFESCEVSISYMGFEEFACAENSRCYVVYRSKCPVCEEVYSVDRDFISLNSY